MSDTYKEIHCNTTCAICEEKRRCKHTPDKSKWTCFRESLEKVNGFTRVKSGDACRLDVRDDVLAEQGRKAAPPTSKSACGKSSQARKAHATREAVIEATRRLTGGTLAGDWTYNEVVQCRRVNFMPFVDGATTGGDLLGELQPPESRHLTNSRQDRVT